MLQGGKQFLSWRSALSMFSTMSIAGFRWHAAVGDLEVSIVYCVVAVLLESVLHTDHFGLL